jgi:tRNA(Ile)-lysidine synthase
LHFDHGTQHGAEAKHFVVAYCEKNKIPVVVGTIDRERRSDESPEEYWRNARYDFFGKYTDKKIIISHNLDDQVENWIFTSLNGNPMLMPYSREPNIIRPFITTTKAELLAWCDKNKVPYLTDPSNSNPKYMRSLIRKEIVPLALQVNPGIFKVIKKKILKSL